ncbi:MAG: hypothetical protein ACYTAN_06105 [Planctomycetota bacterium]
MECKKDENQKKCICPHEDCPRHAVCCDCVAYHRDGGELPMCLRNMGTEG